jgi:hypothetical protein
MAEPEPTYDCFHDMPAVKPNGDISGQGVSVGSLVGHSRGVLDCLY